jgi:hypothetical protein
MFPKSVRIAGTLHLTRYYYVLRARPPSRTTLASNAQRTSSKHLRCQVFKHDRLTVCRVWTELSSSIPLHEELDKSCIHCARACLYTRRWINHAFTMLEHTCGVQKKTLLEAQALRRSSTGMLAPVISSVILSGMPTMEMHALFCWSTSGRVGARNTILPVGNHLHLRLLLDAPSLGLWSTTTVLPDT